MSNILLYIIVGWAQLISICYTSAIATNSIQVKTVQALEDNELSSSDELQILQEKIMDIEEQQKSLRKEVEELRLVFSPNKFKKHRSRRDVASLPNSPRDCLPGSDGCPVTVTPYSVGGSCILCPGGPRGYPGPAGPEGREGRDGRDAIAVFNAAGHDMCNDRSYPHYSLPSNTSGSIYVRWGNKECPSSSILIYTGVAAGGDHHVSGGGANQLCLTNDPNYDDTVVGGVSSDSRSFLYAMEYQIDDFPYRNDRAGNDVPCAVCKAPARFAKLMVPGKNECLSEEWTLEYVGYLMAERSHSVHMRSMFICVDREMQTVDRTSGYVNTSGRLTLTESRCTSTGGGLPCGPYIDGHEMTCAVCTQ